MGYDNLPSIGLHPHQQSSAIYFSAAISVDMVKEYDRQTVETGEVGRAVIHITTHTLQQLWLLLVFLKRLYSCRRLSYLTSINDWIRGSIGRFQCTGTTTKREQGLVHISRYR